MKSIPCTYLHIFKTPITYNFILSSEYQRLRPCGRCGPAKITDNNIINPPPPTERQKRHNAVPIQCPYQ